MISFIVCLCLIVLGYLTYSKVVDNTFAPDDRETPAVAINDGVDFVVLPQWKLFLVQLLNIAGLGPIFGAMQGALWGPIVFLWITFGTVFAGYLSRRDHEERYACLLRDSSDHGRYRIRSRTCRPDREADQ